MTRGVVAVDATSLELTRSVSVVVSDEFVGDDDVSKIDTDDGGLELHCAARVDGENKHPLDATVTEGDTDESLHFNLLTEDVEVFDRGSSPARRVSKMQSISQLRKSVRERSQQRYNRRRSSSKISSVPPVDMK
jgi:hypothetical protein